MRSTIIAAAFAASAMAVPYANPEQVIEYATDIVYVTNVVTVTEGANAPPAEPTPAPYTVVTVTEGAAPPAEATTTPTVAAAEAPQNYDQGGNWGGNGGWHWPHGHSSKTSTKKTRTRTRTKTPEPTPETTQEPAPSPPPSYEPATSAQQMEPAATTVSGYNDIVVLHHNVHRQNHSAPDVTWDAGLAATAQKIAESCVYAHNVEMDGGGYGQNIAAGVESGNVSAIITDLFYNGEIGYYGDMYGSEPSMALFEKWGHFSQIVWKNTKTVGCATQYCPNGLGNTGSNVAPYFTVCNYGPPGNYGGEYADNVLHPDGERTVQWSYGL